MWAEWTIASGFENSYFFIFFDSLSSIASLINGAPSLTLLYFFKSSKNCVTCQEYWKLCYPSNSRNKRTVEHSNPWKEAKSQPPIAKPSLNSGVFTFWVHCTHFLPKENENETATLLAKISSLQVVIIIFAMCFFLHHVLDCQHRPIQPDPSCATCAKWAHMDEHQPNPVRNFP